MFHNIVTVLVKLTCEICYTVYLQIHIILPNKYISKLKDNALYILSIYLSRYTYNRKRCNLVGSTVLYYDNLF